MAKTISISKYPLWKKAQENRTLLMLSLELTFRCNNNCIHCYNNLPQEDDLAIKKELSTQQVKDIVDQTLEMGTLWIHLTGGEPLLREDFFELYEYMKKKGLLVSVFTNATLITDQHIQLFKRLPPRDIEVTVYGIPEKSYAKVTRKNNFSRFISGLDKMLSVSLPVTLKAMIMKSNYDSYREISEFCKKRSYKNFRFDPFLNLRIDRDSNRNQEIINQRLSTRQIIELEKKDPKRREELKRKCAALNKADTLAHPSTETLLKCGAGLTTCAVDPYGKLKLCGLLVKDSWTYDLPKGRLKDAWNNFVPDVRSLKSYRKSYHETCGSCTLSELCMSCPARSDLETGELDGRIESFCSYTKYRHDYCKSP